MKESLLNWEDVALARECGVGVFLPSNPAFEEKCRWMGLALPEGGGPETLMLEYDLSSFFMLGIVIPLGGCGVYLCMKIVSEPVAVLLAAVLLYGCVSLVVSRQRLVFNGKDLYVAVYHGLWWTIRHADVNGDMILYWHRQPNRGISLRLSTATQDIEVLSPFASGRARSWTEAFFPHWKQWREARMAASLGIPGERL